MTSVKKFRSLAKKGGVFICCLLFMALAGTVHGEGLEIGIDVAPKVLNIESSGTVVTVHTNIKYWQVNAHTVTLNGLEIESWKADNLGFFVAKFEMDEVKGMADDGYLDIPDYYTVRLEGETKPDADGIIVFFGGQIDIWVIDIDPVAAGKP